MKAKKIIAVLLALVMVLALGAAAFADDTPTGSITITNTTSGKAYNVYKIFDAKVLENGNITYSYTGELPENDYFAKDTAGNIVYLGEDEELSEEAITFLGTLKPTNPAFAGTGNGAELVFSNVPYGYYYITSSLGTAVTVDSVNADVSVVDKNQKPSWGNDDDPSDEEPAPGKVILKDGEELTVTSANYGDVLTFDVGVVATNYDVEEQIVYYYVQDQLGEGFTYIKDASNKVIIDSVKAGDTEITDYSLYMGADGQSFQIVIPWATVASDAGNKITSITSSYASPVELHIQYKAAVNESIEIAGDGDINTANFTYVTAKAGDEVPEEPEDDPEIGDEPPEPNNPYQEVNEKNTTTYVYALGITKVDGKTKAPLKGAEFTIEGVQALEESAGVYKYCTAGTEGAVTTFKTNDSGVLEIKGLAAGDYEVTESKAPEGYNAAVEPITVSAEIEETANYTTTYTTYYDKDGNVADELQEGAPTLVETYTNKVAHQVIENNAGAVLPATGGIGTTIFYILGSILLVCAGVLFITRKRISADE